MKDYRYLTKSDYYEIITEEALSQVVSDTEEYKFKKAEDSAEMSMIEYLAENYEIEKVLAAGKNIHYYERKITYPSQVYIDYNGVPCKVLKSINGYKKPETHDYWEETSLLVNEVDGIEPYSQFKTYYAENNDYCYYNNIVYKCLVNNGYDFDMIVFPGIKCWNQIESPDWVTKEYPLNSVCKYNGKFYTLFNIEGYDYTINPSSDTKCWGEIADYDSTYNEYKISNTEYVVCDDKVYYPVINVNSDTPVIGTNIVAEDPRNKNVKKHLVRLALYELVKNISPNNVSVIRQNDYEESKQWLSDANKLKINPMIERKLDETNQPNSDWAIAGFQKSYDPYQNPWQV